MNGSTITTFLLALGLAGAGVYDVYVSLRWGEESSVSAVVRYWSREYPMIPFAVGVLVGHLFWR